VQRFKITKPDNDIGQLNHGLYTLLQLKFPPVSAKKGSHAILSLT